MRIDNKKQNKMKTHKFTLKTLNGKNHGQRRRKFTISIFGTKWERCEQLQQKHNYHSLKNYTSLHIYIYIYERVINKASPFFTITYP